MLNKSMLEIVARALCLVNHSDPDKPIELFDYKFMWQLYIKDAEAAIKAMCEPTEEMMKSIDQMDNDCFMGYQAMIDAALKE